MSLGRRPSVYAGGIGHAMIPRMLIPLMLSALLLAGCAAAPAQTPEPGRPAPAPAQTTEPGRSVASPPPAAEPGRTTSAPAAAEPGRPVSQREFSAWIGQFSAQARAAGIDEATLRSAFANVRYRADVVRADREQPEFTRAIWDYLDRALSPQRVDAGRENLRRVRALPERTLAPYGVDPVIVVAIWGIESDYGRMTGDIPTVDALATLGFDGRREEWARRELTDALRILQAGDITRARMLGSWAGAMGQTQFLPSAFVAHAVDADGDGRRDIWGSLADVVASTARFLVDAGWQSGQPWGVEVRLPQTFDVSRADRRMRQSSAQWAQEGVQTIDGAALPAFDHGSILLPAGARGPAFLIGPNFRALLRYNPATSYALAVSLLAQRIDGGPAVQTAWPRELQMLSRSQVVELQTLLNERGFDSGAVDGLPGPATSDGIRRFQRSVGLAPDGYPTLELLRRLQQP